MKVAGEFMKKYGTFAVIPFWAWFLMFPFTGIVNALWIALATGGMLALWKLLKTGTVAGLFRSAGRRLSDLSPLADRIAPFLKSPAALIALLFLFIVIPYFQNDYYRDVLTLTCMYAVLALGLNLVVGQTGLLNLGYVAFYAVGAYTYAILSAQFGVAFWPGLLAGAFSASIFAALVGLPTLKLRGDYFAIVTLGLGEITRIVLNNWDRVTGGPNGIANIGRPVLFGHSLASPFSYLQLSFSPTLQFYYLILAIAVLTVVAMRRLMESRIGRAWIAIREDETAAEAMGINTFRLKMLAFVLGSAWAGAVGVFFAAKMAFVSPESFTFFESVMILCMVVLGGMGSIPGIVLGAFLLIALPEFFREFQDYRMLAFGVALVAMMIFRPQGILGKAKT